MGFGFQKLEEKQKQRTSGPVSPHLRSEMYIPINLFDYNGHIHMYIAPGQGQNNPRGQFLFSIS